jgi:23S rRNA (adenine1618-N6)-methyltransferase
MSELRQNAPAEKTNLHPRNQHRARYDFTQLTLANPALARFVKLNAHNDSAIDFANPQAVKALNQALLKQFYAVSHWDIPAQYLCPPIPGRADYLHYVADLLAAANNGVIPRGERIRVLDIGVGANAIYPLIGCNEYGWRFVGADIDAVAIANAQRILAANSGLSDLIELRLQATPSAIFKGIIQPDETFDLTMCNPPFHGSMDEASAATVRKLKNLDKSRGKNTAKNQAVTLNFGGQAAELYCEGGEAAFVGRMISESLDFKAQCFWFSSLISKADSLPSVYRALKQANAVQIKTIEMSQGQKKSRLVAWTFLNASQQQAWRDQYWQSSPR